MASFNISGKVTYEKDKLIRSDIGLDKHLLKYLRILVAALPGPATLYVFSVLRMSLTSSFVTGDKENQFSFEFSKYESTDLGAFGISLTRPFATDVKILLKWFEVVR